MKKILALFLTLFTAAATAADDSQPDYIYAVHSETHHLIAMRGRAFRAHDDIAHLYIHAEKTHRVCTLRIVPGQTEAVVVSTEDIPDDSDHSVTRSSMALTSRTMRWDFDEDGGNVYIVKNRCQDDAAVIEVKNLPEGYMISQSTAVPHEGKLLLMLQEKATGKYSFVFYDVATCTLGDKLYPAGTEMKDSLIWRGGNLVWQITPGRLKHSVRIYDLESEQYACDTQFYGAYYDVIVPMGRQLVCVKFNGDVVIKTPLDAPQIAADATAPRNTTLYGVSWQPCDTIFRAPGKVFTANESTFYRRIDQYVYELRISNETHFSENPVFDATGYLSSHPGDNPYISSLHTGEIALNGGDEFLLPETLDATPLRVKNVPSGYVIDACAAVACGDKLALHLTNEAEGKSAYALLNTDTAAIEGPLHPIPLSRPASLIQREADIIWEVGKAKAWELPLTAYDLRENKQVFHAVLDSPRIICILGNKVYYVDIDDLLKIEKTMINPAPVRE